MRLNPFAEQMVLSGDVVYYRFIMRMENLDAEEGAWRSLVKDRQSMEEEMSRVTKEMLGLEFDIRNITPLRGSIEILVVVGTTYYAVSRYKNLIESLELLKDQLERLIRRFFSNRTPEPLSVTSSMTLGPSVASRMMSDGSTFDANKLLLGYLILSHAAMLVLFIWIIIKRIATP